MEDEGNNCWEDRVKENSCIIKKNTRNNSIRKTNTRVSSKEDYKEKEANSKSASL